MRFNLTSINSGFHSSPPHEYSEYLVLYHGLHGNGKYVEHQPHAGQHDEQIEETTERRERPQLFIPYSSHSEHCHIDSVEIAPALNEDKTGGADKKDRGQGQPAARKPAGSDYT